MGSAGSNAVGEEQEVLPILSGSSQERNLAQLPCFMMETPVRNQDFFGRQRILQQLDEYLLPSAEPEGQKHVAICGIGGIGKTSIAVEYAFSRRDKFDAIIWIRAHERARLDQDFQRISQELGLQNASAPINSVTNLEIVKAWLECPKKDLNQDQNITRHAEAQWLIVFDGADDPDLLEDYWPLSRSGSILVTSRDPLAKITPSMASKSIDIQPFSNGEAAELLRRLSGPRKDEGMAHKIASRLGGLPLAISQMAAIIRCRDLSFAEFFQRYENPSERRELHSCDAVTPRSEARGNVATIWAIEQLKPPARTLLELCALLDPDCIQERLFTSRDSNIYPLEGFPMSGFTFSGARADLIKRSLITRNSEKREFMVNRILQDSVQSKMTEKRMLDVFSTAVSLVLNAWGHTPLDKRHVISLAESREGLFPHAVVLRSIYEKHFAQNPEAGIELAKLMNEAGWYQHERGNSQDMKPFLSLALEICDSNPGPRTSPLLADLHYGLAAAANETNDAEGCLAHTQKLLELRIEATKHTGARDLRLAVAYNEIGIAWVMNREYGKAIQAFEDSIEVYRGLADYWTSMDTNPRTNMGFTYWVMGELERATRIFEQLLRDRESRFGPDDKESYRTGRVYHGLGNVRFNQGLYEESERWHQRALSQYQATLGNAHHKTADLCHKLAQHCIRRGEVEDAKVLIEQALKIYRMRESVYLPELARTTFLKATLFQALDELEASRLVKEAVSRRGRIPGACLKADDTLTEADFDELVTFFSR